MKRILIVATTSYAGMGPYVSEIVNNFSIDNEIYYFFYESEDNFFYKNIKKELHSKSYFYKKANSKINKIIDLLPIRHRSYNIILDLCKKHKIGIVHFINGPGDLNLIQSLEKMKIVCISTIHDLHPHESKKEWYKELRAKIRYKHLYNSFLYSHNIITNSIGQYNELKLDFNNMRIFYHSFPSLVSDNIKKGNEIPIELTNLNKPYILFFGRIEEYKGISLLYKVFTEELALYENYFLVIAGKGTIPFNRNSNEKNVIIMNRYIKDTEIANLYKNAACVVYPYISATQSGVLSLAYYFETPILASDVPFFKDSIQQSKNRILFRNGNLKDLKEKLLLLLNSRTLSQTEEQQAYYNKFYNGITIRNELIRIYSEL